MGYFPNISTTSQQLPQKEKNWLTQIPYAHKSFDMWIWLWHGNFEGISYRSLCRNLVETYWTQIWWEIYGNLWIHRFPALKDFRSTWGQEQTKVGETLSLSTNPRKHNSWKLEIINVFGSFLPSKFSSSNPLSNWLEWPGIDFVSGPHSKADLPLGILSTPIYLKAQNKQQQKNRELTEYTNKKSGSIWINVWRSSERRRHK